MESQAKLSLPALESRILVLIKEFLHALGNERAVRALSLQASLDRDLGLGSLERVELVFRIEKQLGVQLPERMLFEAETVADLVRAIQDQQPIYLPTAAVIPPIIESISEVPVAAQTLVEVLQHYARTNPNRPHIYLQQIDEEEQVITYSQLYENATACAYGLRQLGIQPGDKVAIMLPTSKDFFYAFFSSLLIGAVPVPVYPPIRPKQIEEYALRQAGILRNAQAHILITDRNIEKVAALLQPLVPSLNHTVTITDLMKWQLPRFARDDGFARDDVSRDDAWVNSSSPQDSALIQYTSGSTGDPKGVLLTHQNLLANIRAIGEAIAAKPTDVTVSWLPLYHDMGLIGSWLGSLYFGTPFIVMSPLTFLAHPERWLWAIHYHQGTISAAPNFAYELCVRKIADEAIEGLDLSSWRIAFNGAEAVSPSTLERFTQRFSRYGFAAGTLAPVYGLAESSVGLTFPPLGRKPVIDKIKREVFLASRQAQPATPNDRSPLQFVACGVPLPGHEIRIMDEAGGNALPERTEGQLQFRGPSSMRGYFNSPEANEQIFAQDDWLNTGDLAYIANQELYITGQKKISLLRRGGIIIQKKWKLWWEKSLEFVGAVSLLLVARIFSWQPKKLSLSLK